MQNHQPLGLVLSAGGARAAYQVGVLKAISEKCPKFVPQILTGISAGSINASFLAQGEPFPEACHNLYDLWSELTFDHVLKSNFSTLLQMGLRWISDLFLSKVTGRLLLKSLLDASPLAHTLLLNTHFWKISKTIREGQLLALAISATNYHNGLTTIFFDSTDPIVPWSRERRVVKRTPIRVRHIMASCSIPVLFEPVPIGDTLYGDGSLRINFPFSPAIHLGAKKIFGVSVHGSHEYNTAPPSLSLGIGFVAGALLNSIFLDSLEYDYDNLARINYIVGENSPRYRPVHIVRPSGNLAKLASESIQDMPFNLRQLLRSTAKTDELGELLSYLMFSPSYIKALLKMGEADANAQMSEIENFCEGKKETPLRVSNSHALND